MLIRDRLPVCSCGAGPLRVTLCKAATSSTAFCRIATSEHTDSLFAFQAQLLPKNSRIACRAAARPQASPQQPDCAIARRQSLLAAAAVSLLPFAPQAALAKGRADLAQSKDTNDGYEFLYPFGWQEVSVKGQDVVYKDVIEPLESVSVSIAKTDKTSIQDYGPLSEVAATLATEVLTPPNQKVKILDLGKREVDGREYYQFEFASKANTYIRHALAIVTIANGKLYTLTTGANENRWGKMKERLEDVIQSFRVADRYVG